MKPWLLKLHRWVALIFALPLFVVVGSGLVLSFEPSAVVAAIRPGTLSAEKVNALLAKHDPAGRARAIAFRSYDNALSIGGRGGKTVDAASGEEIGASSTLSSLFIASRQLHERLMLGAGGVVLASTIAMLVLVVLGVLMGLPRLGLARTMSGWHKGIAWGLLPLVVLSPLTGLMLGLHISLTEPASGPRPKQGPPMKLADAVRVVGAKHDLSGLVWLRPQGPRLLARVVEDGEYRVYAVTPLGTQATPRNWPRLWHEGNFAGHVSAGLNVVTSVALIGLLFTGLYIWTRRQIRRSQSRRQRGANVATQS